MPWGWDLIPGVNVGQSIANLPGNIVKQLQGQDADFVEGVSVKGGARNPVGNVLIGPTAGAGSGGGGGNQTVAADTNASGSNIASGYNAAAVQDAREKANTIGMLDNELAAIAGSLGRLDTTWNAGKTQISDAYDKGMSRLNEQQSNALSNYATKRTDSKQSFQNSLTDNDNQAFNNFTALNSLLGRAGAGSSSAAQNLVPYAVSRTASKSRGTLADTYGKNMRDLTTAEDETKQSYNNSVRDLGDQKNTNLGNLENDIQGKRSTYLNQQAQLQGQKSQAQGGDWNTVKNAMSGSVQQRNDVDTALASLLDRYRNPYNVQDVTVKDPTLSNYAVDTAGVKANDPSGTGNDTDTSANYLQKIEDEEKRKKYQNLVA